MKKVDPKKYNLSSRLNLEKDSENNYYIVINRKSRIIMKDGIKIKNQATQIKSFDSNAKVKLKYSNKNFPTKPLIPKIISNIYPVTTGGKTRGKLRRLIKNFLNKNSFLANKYPKKIAKGKLTKDAVNAIFSDK